MSLRFLLRACAGIVLCAALAPAALHAAVDPVHESRLDNGMKIIVKEDRRAPVVVSMVWYRAGSMDEFNGTTGVAHVLEHMMFKGTHEVPPGEFSRTIARAGGRDNAFTNRDYTAYYQQLHKSQLSLALKLEADRMADLLLSEEEFSKEIRVVMEERRLRTDDQPKSLLYEAFMAAAYQAHPYRTPVVGWMDDLEAMRATDARAWYERWYAPNNATLVVVGDVSAADVFEQAQHYFGAIPAKPMSVRKPQHEPLQLGVKRVTVKAQAELPYVLMGWHVPVLRNVAQDWEPYALWVLSAVLDGNDAARLQRALVRDSRVAVSTGSSYDAVNRGPGMFLLSATPSAGADGRRGGGGTARTDPAHRARRRDRRGTQEGQGSGDCWTSVPTRLDVQPGHADGRPGQCRLALRFGGPAGQALARCHGSTGPGRRQEIFHRR